LPEPFIDFVIAPTSLANYADLDVLRIQKIGERQAGESMASTRSSHGFALLLANFFCRNYQHRYHLCTCKNF
jgi:hypothetical protein